MFKQTQGEKFRTFFLLQFTKELIKHSGAGEVFELEKVLEEEKKEKKSKLKSKIVSKIKPPILSQLQIREPSPRPPIKKRLPSILKIPEPKLPPRLQYLRPTPTSVQIDLDKLNPLIKDPMVRSIECYGEGENIIVRGNMGTKKTNIVLNKQEIDQIIKRFLEIAKIPIQEGISRVVVGKLILSAIISEVISSKFIIKKMMYGPRVFGR